MAAFRITPGVPVGVEVRRIATDQVTRALGDLEREDRDEAVHEVRKRCKKVRALVRLVRGADEELYRRENAAFRDVARRLSEVRDATAAVESFDAFAAAIADQVDTAVYGPIRAGLVAHRDDRPDQVEVRASAARADLERALERITAWSVPGDGAAPLRGGLERTYRRARRRMADAVELGTDEALHEWRKWATYHRHHVRLLEASWPSVMRSHRSELRALTEHLGQDHDLAVLRSIVDGSPDAHGGAGLVGGFIGLLEHGRGQLQADARALGARCFAERPSAFTGRVAKLWVAAGGDRGSSRLTDPPMV